MKTPHTNPIYIGEGAAAHLREHVTEKYPQKDGFIICDINTERFTHDLPGTYRYVLHEGVIADTAIAEKITIPANVGYLIACGSGTVHDITRHTAHRLGLPFISYPTAPSMDGFVSGIAAMTIKGQKLSVPSTPPSALFAEPAVYTTAPRRFVLAGVGDIIGKYISLADWRVTALLLGETIDPEIESLVTTSIDDMLKLDPESDEFKTAVLKGLINTGMAIQFYGSSRPSSGAEHHFSHIWEMHCINEETDALHGEKVGVSTLMLLKVYKELKSIKFSHKTLDPDVLRPIFGELTDGIIAENKPAESDVLTQEKIDANMPKILEILAELPEYDELVKYYDKLGMLKTLKEIGLPDDEEFVKKTFEFAPYVRKRMTLLRII